MTRSTFCVETNGAWSGGGRHLLGLTQYAAKRHPVFGEPDDSIPIIARNHPKRGQAVARPFVLAPQNAWPWNHPEWHRSEIPRVLALRAVSEHYLRRASAVLRISSAIPILGTPERFSPILHNVLDPAFEGDLKASYEIDSSAAEGKIVCITSVTSYRNVRRFIEALSHVPERPEALICGPVGTRAVAHQIDALASESQQVTVRWGLLSRAQCLAYFRAAACVILPSMVEASPFTLLEAVAVQPRVVLSDIAANREIIQPFGAMPPNNYFNPTSVTAIAASLTNVAAATQVHESLSTSTMRENARKTWTETLASWLSSLDLTRERR